MSKKRNRLVVISIMAFGVLAILLKVVFSTPMEEMAKIKVVKKEIPLLAQGLNSFKADQGYWNGSVKVVQCATGSLTNGDKNLQEPGVKMHAKDRHDSVGIDRHDL